MKLLEILFILLIFLGIQSAWSGTTEVVLQNYEEGGYQGCQDAWIDKDWDLATGQDVYLQCLWELCPT